MDEKIGTQCLGSGFLFVVPGNDGYIAAHCFGQLDAHLSKSTKAHNSNMLAFAATLLQNVSVQGAIHRNCSAKQDAGILQLHALRDMEDEMVANSNVGAVTSIGVVANSLFHVSSLAVRKLVTVRLRHGRTVVLETFSAKIAAAAAFDHASNTDSVANLEAFDFGANFLDDSSDFMTRSCNESGDVRRKGKKIVSEFQLQSIAHIQLAAKSAHQLTAGKCGDQFVYRSNHTSSPTYLTNRKLVQSPVSIARMNITVAHATVLDVDCNIVWAARRSSEFNLLQIAVGVESRQEEGAFSIFDRCHVA